MEDAIKILNAKFKLSGDVLTKVSDESSEVSSWLNMLGAYILDNDKKQEEQRDNEALLRRQRLNAEHQLSQLEKQLIACNVQVTKYEKNVSEMKKEATERESSLKEVEKSLQESLEEGKKRKEENESMKHRYSTAENEKGDFSAMLEKKNKEIDRLNEEWQEASKKLADSNKERYELKYKLDEIKNSDIRKEFKEKRLEQEKTMLTRQLEQTNNELKNKTTTLSTLQKDKTASLLGIETKYSALQQKHTYVETSLETFKLKCEKQEKQIEGLLTKLKNASEERLESENNMQQELTAQTKLVQLYKDDRDHAKEKLEEVTSAITEIQGLMKQVGDEKTKIEAQLTVEKEVSGKKIAEIEARNKQLTTELDNANDLLQVSRKAGSKVVTEAELSNLSPLAAATSSILKKGMSLTQIYTEYVKTSDELLLEKEENSRLKLYMEQILQEVEEKAPLLMQQKDDYEHARHNVQNLAEKLQDNIKESHHLQNQCSDYERKVDFHKREEKRLHSLCVDLSQQVRILLKEVEEARGGVVSSSNTLQELLTASDEPNASSSGQVISEHLVTFKSIEELQAQNQRLLLTVRELSEEQEKLEQEGGPEIIQELKKKIDDAKLDLDSMRENNKTQDNMMQQLARQRDMYKVLCQQGGVMVGEVSSTSFNGSKSQVDLEMELTKLNAEHDNTLLEQKKLKENVATKERSLNDMISKQYEEVSALKLERDRVKNKIELAEERYSILQTTSEGYKREAQALEGKCKTITEALGKARIEAETYKQDYGEAREKLVAAEVNLKSVEVEKNLIKEAEKRIMQENQSMLDQQRSQNVLLNNLQTIQNNLERQEFETRKSLSKEVDSLQREVKALQRQRETESQQLKSSTSVLESDIKELQVHLGVEKEKSKQTILDLAAAKSENEKLNTKLSEMELVSKATEERLDSVLEREASGKAKEDYQREMEMHKTKVRELELALENLTSSKKAVEEQLEVTKKHLEQFKEICDSSEVALSTLTKLKEEQGKGYESKLNNAEETIKKLRAEVDQHQTMSQTLKKANDESDKAHQYTVSELRGQMAPLERRFQEVTRALVQAKEIETEAVKEKDTQVAIAKDAQKKYETEIVLHGKDVELMTKLKDELKAAKEKYSGIEESEMQVKKMLENNDALMNQVKEANQQEVRKAEAARKDLISQNAILHGQVEKLSAQLASAKSQTRTEDTTETFSDKSLEEVYELLRFVRREKEIAETKSEASETESMRYRQRAEHLQRDLDEAKEALELEIERTKGRMLTEGEHNELLEKVKKAKEFEEVNENLVKESVELDKKHKITMEKNKKLEADMKPLVASKKALEGEKGSWLAEKTAFKQEIDRWTNRTNQLMAQCSKGESEEVKKLQANKVHSEKAIAGLQEEVRRTKQQLDFLKRESLKLKSENNELQGKMTTLQNELKAASIKTIDLVDSEQVTSLEKEVQELKKTIETNTTQLNDLTEKNKVVPQLKKLAKKYKVQCDKLQTVLKQNNLETDGTATAAAPTATATAPATAITIDDAPSSSTGSTETTVSTETPTLPLTIPNNTTTNKPLTDDEKMRYNEQLEESSKNVVTITKELDELRSLHDINKLKCTALENKLEETQKTYVESEKKVLEMKKSLETLQAECNEKEKEKEKNKKLLKTAKDKIGAFSKNKDSNNREVESLKKQIDELQKALEQSTTSITEQANSFNAVRVQLDVKIINLEKQVEMLLSEKRVLMERLEDVQRELESVHEQKKAADKFIKAASKQKSSRIQAVPPGGVKTTVLCDNMPGADALTNTPLTATVRPSATPSSQATSKYHPQSTRTASIRPLAHAAPTAMISPTVPITQSSSAPTLVASVSALPPTTSSSTFTPQVAEVQGRSTQSRQLGDRSNLSFKAPVARVQVQAQGREEESDNVPTMEDDQLMEQQASSSSTTSDTQQRVFGKRSHVEITEEADDENIALLEDSQPEQSGMKRQRVENIDETQEDQLIADSQEGELEEDLLAEDVEEGDDDVIGDMPSRQYGEEMPTQGSCVSREVQLQMERSLQPSPQELLRQSRLQGRVRTQLPSFSLVPGSQSSSGFYEETDDSTVPSTPTLFMPKRTDGFAEAVSSPVVRFPAFSFASNEQPSGSVQSSALELPGMHLHETRVDLMNSEDQANVPQTPLSVVPVSSVDQGSTSQEGMSSQREERRVTFEQQFFPEDNGQEQNVPQQIDLTEDDDDEDDGHDLAQASEEIGEVITEDGEEAIDIMATDNDLVDLDDEGESDEDDDGEEEIDSDTDDDDSSSGKDVEGGDVDEDSRDAAARDVVEIHIDDEESFDEEEKEKIEAEDVQAQNIPDEKLSPVYGGPASNDLPQELTESSETPLTTETTILDQQAASSSAELKEEEPVVEDKVEAEKAKPVRITRTARGGGQSARGGIRPRIRRTTNLPGRAKNTIGKSK